MDNRLLDQQASLEPEGSAGKTVHGDDEEALGAGRIAFYPLVVLPSSDLAAARVNQHSVSAGRFPERGWTPVAPLPSADGKLGAGLARGVGASRRFLATCC